MTGHRGALHRVVFVTSLGLGLKSSRSMILFLWQTTDHASHTQQTNKSLSDFIIARSAGLRVWVQEPHRKSLHNVLRTHIGHSDAYAPVQADLHQGIRDAVRESRGSDALSIDYERQQRLVMPVADIARCRIASNHVIQEMERCVGK